ncbi:MAG: histidine kinase dimerization/phospho-acceptor domain-containing protein, partial [Thermoanaerobaculia bacterium]
MASRSGLIVVLLLLSLALAAVLAVRAQMADVNHRAVAENVLRDYARLAADELVRRMTTKVGYEGFYPLITFLKQRFVEAPTVPPPAPADLARSGDEGIRAAADLVHATFRITPDGVLSMAEGSTIDTNVARWITTALAQPHVEPPGRRYSMLIAPLSGRARTVVYARLSTEPASPIVGFEVSPDALRTRFQAALVRPLLPPSLLRQSLKNDILFIRVADAAGNELLRAGQQSEPYLPIERRFGSDYNGLFDGTVIHAAVDPAAAGALVIGGLPRSRLPVLLGLLLLASLLTLTAVLQLRREWALAALRSEFVAQVSHELRTPLTQIRMFSETLLLDRVRSEEERRRSLEIIDREARRLDHLVENLLRFSRGERGEARIATKSRDLVPLVRQLLAEFEPLA